MAASKCVIAAVLVAMCGTASAATPLPWMDASDPPASRAAKLVAVMNLTEKVTMLHGWSSPDMYTGYVPPQSLAAGGSIPAIKMNDGPQGYRFNPGPGTSTSWPSGLTVGATFDVDMASAWATAMGKEFYGKGANVQLGPGMCLARVPNCGRNFEYIAGEDPELGRTMVPPVIKGIQSQGVIANAKHYINNNQETDRTTQTAVVDERTEFEMYLPAFEAAAEAGVGSVMCSYNLISNVPGQPGKWSCEHPETLAVDLKQRVNFSGWVMSDWGATHSTSIQAGLDQEMPGGNYMGDALQTAVQNGSIPVSAVNDSVMRILTPMFQMGIFDTPNNNNITTNVTSPEHNALARKIASAAMVLLKNDGDVLPFDDSVTKIAVIGDQAQNPTVHGGGSGQVIPYYVSAPADAIRGRFGIKSPPLPPTNCSDAQWTTGIDYRNQDSQSSSQASSISDCCNQCAARTPPCYAFTLVQGTCWMKGDDSNPVQDSQAVSGIARSSRPPAVPACSADGSHCVYYDDGHNITSAMETAARADVAIVFAYTTSSEGGDRKDLNLNDNANDLISNVSAAAKRTVVVMVSPGAVLTPWRDGVDAIISAFMPGQEYGNAVSDVLWGDVAPTARLPLTFPAEENQIGLTPSQWPGVNKVSTYSEMLEVGYRYYDAHNLEPAFPFGHGLTYGADFEYQAAGLVANRTGVSFSLINSGTKDGREVVQVYLGFPSSAGEPPKQLKAFKIVPVKAGATVPVSLPLTDRSFSTWDVSSHSWQVATGTFQVMIGSSSRDIRLNTTITI